MKRKDEMIPSRSTHQILIFFYIIHLYVHRVHVEGVQGSMRWYACEG